MCSKTGPGRILTVVVGTFTGHMLTRIKVIVSEGICSSWSVGEKRSDAAKRLNKTAKMQYLCTFKIATVATGQHEQLK